MLRKGLVGLERFKRLATIFRIAARSLKPEACKLRLTAEILLYLFTTLVSIYV